MHINNGTVNPLFTHTTTKEQYLNSLMSAIIPRFTGVYIQKAPSQKTAKQNCSARK
jgi:hypothetical protein